MNTKYTDLLNGSVAVEEDEYKQEATDMVLSYDKHGGYEHDISSIEMNDGLDRGSHGILDMTSVLNEEIECMDDNDPRSELEYSVEDEPNRLSM